MTSGDLATKIATSAARDRAITLPPEVETLSRRERRRLRKEIGRELTRQSREAGRAAKGLRKQARDEERDHARRSADIMRERRRRIKELKRRSQERRDVCEAADNVIESIGYDLMFRNGVCEVEPGVFSETISFEDIAYQNSREDDQLSKCWILRDLYNYLDEGVRAQVSVQNTPLRAEEIGARRFYDEEAQPTEAARQDAREMNRILNDKLREGVSNIRRTRSITLSVDAVDLDAATRRFATVNMHLSSVFERLKCGWHVMDGEERLGVINSMLRPGRRLSFDFDRDITPQSKLCTKDFIAPMTLDFRPGGESTFYRSDGTFCQTLVIRSISTPLSDSVVSSLVDLPMPINVSWFATPIRKSKAVLDVGRKSQLINKEVTDSQKQAVRGGYDYELGVPTNVKETLASSEDLLSRISGKSQSLFFFTGLIWTYADTLEALVEQVGQIIDTASLAGVEVEPLPYRQREALNSVLPLGANRVSVTRYLTSDEICVWVPFANNELDDEGGSWYYQNKLSNNLVLGNRARLASPVGFIAGKTGSGKGFFVKNEIEGICLSKPGEQVIILDRAGEYVRQVRHHEGLVVTFGPDSKDHVNPLGMFGLEGRSSNAQLAFKCEAILAQASAEGAEADRKISTEERSIIQRCVEEVYREAERDGRVPILQDLYEKIAEQPEPDAARIALRYEFYVNGPFSFFNHEDNVDFSSRLIDFNLKDIPESMLVFTLVALCEAVRNQMYANHARGIRTWLYIEEMESLFRYPTVLEYFRRLANECRKYGMYLTGITQSTSSMVKNEDVNSIVKNADFVMLFSQSDEDRAYWSNALSLSEFEEGCIDMRAKPGDGLLVFGASRIPIRGDFPHDSYLYELFTTNPNDAPREAAGGGA